jgi:pyridoxal phosphate enzyme (YggS family)
VAVSKTHPIEAIKEAYESGQRVFGESRPQELRAKYEALPHDIEWHMIGHLQTNKIKYIAPFVAMIHSVDSERLAEAIQVQAAKCNRTIDVLLEIHVAEEESKSGWAIEDLRAAVASGLFERLPNVRVRGVMGIATNTDDMERIVSDFVQLRIYKEELAAHFGEQFDTLSMGMSDDYPTAIAAGSTMVRIGSTIFGERDYSK